MIEVVGIGLDGAVGLTKTIRKIVEQATLLVGSDRHLRYFPDHRAKRLTLSNLNAALTEISQQIEQEKIVILVSGDPLFFGFGRLLLEKFPPQQLRFHPHLSSLQLAFSQLKIPWQDACIISVHGRTLEQLTPLLQQGTEKIAILTDAVNSPSAIARFYHCLDLPVPYDFWVCENLGSPEEQIHHFPHQKTATLASRSEAFAPLNIVILLRSPDETRLDIKALPQIGLSDRLFLSFSDRPGLMTKRETRLLVLGELALQSQQVVWDLGAGTGSVSIEIARLCPTAKIYAVEKTAMGVTLIERNCQRFQVNNVVAIQGSAPQALDSLPTPDRIFIGGSGGNLLEILVACEQKLVADGVLVLALATLEHTSASLEWLKARAWNYRLLQLQLSRSVAIANLTRYAPLNPVTLITATPEAGAELF